MKKVSIFLFSILTIFAITFSSCQLKVEDEDLFDKPGVEANENQVTIIIPKTSNDTKYINVYRRDKKNDEIVNIGILFQPEALGNDQKNFIYIDTLVKKNHTYDYRARYYTDGNYYYTEWSKNTYIEPAWSYAYPEDQKLSYQANDVNLIYERTDHTLKFEGTITPPDFAEFTSEGYTPMLIIESPKSTQAFEIAPATIENTANREKISLRSMLPGNFLDTDITVKGIVGQKTIYVDSSKPLKDRTIERIIWTAPTDADEITLIGFGSDKKLKIPSQTGSAGLDYSRKAN